NHLEQQVSPALVDRQIAQLIKEENLRTNVTLEGVGQQAVDLGGGQVIEHVDHARVAHGVATLAGSVTQGREEVRLPRSGRTDQDGAAVPWDEVAVEQAHDGGLGNAFG